MRPKNECCLQDDSQECQTLENFDYIDRYDTQQSTFKLV